MRYKEIRMQMELYKAHSARIKANQRRAQSKVWYRKIDTNQTLIKKIESRLHSLISPEFIAHENGIHHQTVYSYIYRARPDLVKQLHNEEEKVGDMILNEQRNMGGHKK
jgi:IS30 family transposase